ncbi:ribonuclease P protein component 1 [Methanohalophilus mahii]|uniref:Ribonuclease P protein component 1 n=1 Tax=Methanohalophilus mahii (strain ATCC 35705 / DSM 5219 / SLP) TaxID=547558 RepID=D5E6R9_METMS|nr:ribonuclease P protein component 1 [Methanohalophilus mahii]ADE36857.1 ribonuclease P protein subunit Rpp29 [Methanohalophilus mahii DSM 5219]
MDISPQNLIYHELIGLMVDVVDSTNQYLAGINGKVVDETRNMLVIEVEDMYEKQVPKSGSKFVFHLPVGSGCSPATSVEVGGILLLSQPENRTKNIRKLRMR